MSFLSVRGLRAGYGKSMVLRDVDLEVEEGEAVAVVGKNGAGKSTLLMSFFGGTKISAGSVRVDGSELSGRPAYVAAKLGASLSPQGRMILPHLSVEENLWLGQACRRKGLWTLDKIYELFPILRERRHASGAALSGGQQQMLAVGRALLGNPRVLMLDEPSEGLSPVLIDELARVFNQIRAAGVGILIVEQHLSLVRRVSQRFVVMSKGEVVDQGPTSEIDDERRRGALAF